ncbi:MAG: PEGA domain-containing protein [Deltaproteobacteria bacterium]|nr:PEGA domain-containing protein [Deltaproteobacteria bacterium]
MRHDTQGLRFTPNRVSRWSFALVGLAWMLPHAVVQGAPSLDDDDAAAPAVVEVKAVAGARVDIDGAFHGGAPVEVLVPAGEHRIQVTAPGYHPWRASVEIEPRARVTVTPDLLPVEAVVEPPLPVRRSASGRPSLRPGVLLATPRTRVFLDKPAPTDASALMKGAPHHADATAFMPAHPKAPAASEEVFLSTPARIFLPARPTADRDSPSDPSGDGSGVFMPTR